MTDNYEYNRSMLVQSENEYSPYTDKQYNSYINDINSGVYQNNGLSLVQFDLSSIYNSAKFTDTNDFICSVADSYGGCLFYFNCWNSCCPCCW